MTTFVTKEAVEVGKGGEAATQDVCRILMAVKLMGDVRTNGAGRCAFESPGHAL